MSGMCLVDDNTEIRLCRLCSVCIYGETKRLRSRSPCSVYAHLCFCERVHADPHKNGTKTKWISTRTVAFENKLQYYSNEFHKTGTMRTHKNRYLWLRICTHVNQCERTKTGVFPPYFLYKMEPCELAAMH